MPEEDGGHPGMSVVTTEPVPGRDRSSKLSPARWARSCMPMRPSLPGETSVPRSAGTLEAATVVTADGSIAAADACSDASRNQPG